MVACDPPPMVVACAPQANEPSGFSYTYRTFKAEILSQSIVSLRQSHVSVGEQFEITFPTAAADVPRGPGKENPFYRLCRSCCPAAPARIWCTADDADAIGWPVNVRNLLRQHGRETRRLRVLLRCRMPLRRSTGQPVVFVAPTPHRIRASAAGRHENRNDKNILYLSRPAIP